MGFAVSAEDVSRAAERIAGRVQRTPSAASQVLSELTGATLSVKFENFQFTASFKERGACNRLLALTTEERNRGVVAMSAGNHAQAVARHARLLGVPATVVMPEHTPNVKVVRTEALGARVVLYGVDLDAAEARARRLADDERLVFVPPYDDRDIIAGQGTVALEMLDDDPDLDVLVVPVGGGGLIAGMAVAAKARRPELSVIGVQTERYPTFVRERVGGPLPGPPTIAEGIAVPRRGSLTTPIVDALVDDVLSVPEGAIEQAIGLYLEVEKVVAEGAGAAGLAALLEHPGRFTGRRVGLVLSGGNIDPHVLAQVIMRSLARSGRITRLTIRIPDTPGTLARVAAVVGRHGANIISVEHDRYRPELALRSAVLGLTIETRDRPHRDAIVAALRGDGFEVDTEQISEA